MSPTADTDLAAQPDESNAGGPSARRTPPLPRTVRPRRTPRPGPGDDDSAASDTWIFPFDEPLAPGEGDTQAVAVNTTDDTASYAVAFALVWADGSEPVDNVNEAYAAGQLHQLRGDRGGVPGRPRRR